jgi:sortase (surface protein transpeptidase)
MTRRARNPLVAILLGAAGSIVFVAGVAAVVAPSDSPAEALTVVTTTTSTTPIGPAVEQPIAAGPVSRPAVWRPVQEATIDIAALRPPPQRPTRIRIEKIGVDAAIIDLGLNPDRTLQVPEDIRLTGWWTGRSVPGEPGPSIVVGHVDSAAQGPGVFWRLRELEIGDVIFIERADGSIAEFRVTETELVLKTEFPTDKVYGSVEGSKLRVITCGGAFDRSARSYLGNLIVYADHVGTTQAPLPEGLDLVG